MKTRTAMLITVVGIGCLSPIHSWAQDQRAITDDVQVMRATAARTLATAARQSSVSIDESRAAVLSAPDLTIASAPVTGVERNGLRAYIQGVNILFVYLKAQPSTIPTGFYTVRVSTTPGNRVGRAEFVDQNGRVIASRPAFFQSLPPDEPVAERFTITISIKFSKPPEIDIVVSLRTPGRPPILDVVVPLTGVLEE